LRFIDTLRDVLAFSAVFITGGRRTSHVQPESLLISLVFSYEIIESL
jgi:hypothetical protein